MEQKMGILLKIKENEVHVKLITTISIFNITSPTENFHWKIKLDQKIFKAQKLFHFQILSPK